MIIMMIEMMMRGALSPKKKTAICRMAAAHRVMK